MGPQNNYLNLTASLVRLTPGLHGGHVPPDFLCGRRGPTLTKTIFSVFVSQKNVMGSVLFCF